MSKDLEKPDLEDRLIDFAVRIIRIAESLPKQEFDLIFVLSFVASLKLTLWNEFKIHIPRGEVLLKPRAQRSSIRKALYYSPYLVATMEGWRAVWRGGKGPVNRIYRNTNLNLSFFFTFLANMNINFKYARNN